MLLSLISFLVFELRSKKIRTENCEKKSLLNTNTSKSRQLVCFELVSLNNAFQQHKKKSKSFIRTICEHLVCGVGYPANKKKVQIITDLHR